MPRAVVVLTTGPACERGWLGLRIALALGLGGHEVTVQLYGEAAGWGVPLEVRAWLEGDPAADLRGLIDDAGAAVHVEAEALHASGIAGRLGDGVSALPRCELVAELRAADLVVPV